jgi:hypothetical protein
LASRISRVNREKKEAKYRYPNSLIWLLLATAYVYLLPYRQLEGFLNVMSEHIPRLKEKVPDYTTMWWRVVKIKIALKPEINGKEKEGILTIAADSTGIKVTNRAKWIRDIPVKKSSLTTIDIFQLKILANCQRINVNWYKWKERRRFIKIHVAINVKTKQIYSMEVTKEDLADGKMLKPLVHDVTTSASFPYARENRIEVIADGTYDSKDNFRYLNELKIKPVIKVRKNSSTNANGYIPRKLVIVEQLENV